MIDIHKPYIAVNTDYGTYMTLNENWYETWECQGRNNVYCIIYIFIYIYSGMRLVLPIAMYTI